MNINKIFGIKQVIPGHLVNQYNAPLSLDELHEVLDEIL